MASRTAWERFFEKIDAEVVDGDCTIQDILEAIPLTVHDFLQRLEAVRKNGKGWMARCPAHEDRNPSLSIKEGEDGKTILHCFGGCKPEAVVLALGLKMSDLFPDNGRHSTPRRGGQLIPDKGRNQNSGQDKVVEAMGKLEATYYYRDAQGEVIFAFDMYRKTDGSKNPVVKRPDGNGGWKYGIKDKKTGEFLVDPVLYDLPAVLSANTIFIVEGEKCAERLQRILPKGEAATTNPFGANKWHDKYSSFLSGKDVIILPDNDESGKKHANGVAKSVYRGAKGVKMVKLPGLLPKGDVVDFLDAGHSYSDIFAQVQETEQWQPDEKQHLKTVTLSEVESESVSFLWEPYIPLGKVTMLEGDPGVGKSWLSMAIGAAVSLGVPILGSPIESGDVLIMSAEDGVADTIKPRLENFEANCQRIHAVTEPITLDSDGIVRIDWCIDKYRPSLFIIDPLVAYMGGNVDLHKANQTRVLMAALAQLATKHKNAIVVVRHLTKSGRDKSIYRGIGSIDLTASVRSVLLVGFDSSDKARRGMVHIKSNLTELGPSLGYTIEEGNFRWTGETDLTDNDILAAETGDKYSAQEEAKEFLRQLLSDGPVLAEDVLKVAKDTRIAQRTVYRAKKKLKIISKKDGFGKGSKFSWKLP